MSSEKSCLMITYKVNKHFFRSIFCFGKPKDVTDHIKIEKKFFAPIYDPIPVVITSGEGTHVWDKDGKAYLDFITGVGSLPLGHSNPRLVKTLRNQACTLAMTSRYVYNDVLPEWGEFMSRYFEYETAIPLSTTNEAGETAIKLARRWGYLKKNVMPQCALIVFPENTFWGRSTSALSSSTNPLFFENFGPYMPGFGLIPFNDINCLETVLKHPNVVAFFMEPIQSEGVILPSKGYLDAVRRITTENNVLWIANEALTGLGRSGAILATDIECVRPDILILGKGLAGGMVPMSAVFTNKNVAKLMTPGSHGSTFGGNPLAAKLSMETLGIIKEQNLMKNASHLGAKFRQMLECTLPKEIVVNVRGQGLLNALQLNPCVIRAKEFTFELKKSGLLASHIDECTVRLLPPLTVTEKELKEAANIIFCAIQKIRGCPC